MGVGVAQVGFGYWGPNHARNLTTLLGRSFRYVVEAAEQRRAEAARLHPYVRVTDRLDEALDDPQVHAVVIATPAATHAPLARRALEAGKHVLVEKPLALSVADAVDLTELAEKMSLVLMVGHTFEFVPAIRRMREYLLSGDAGDLLYLHAQRLNLGRLQRDINAFWSIGPHDVSIANYLTGATPEWVSARGARYLSRDVEDVLFVTAGYPGGVLAHMHVSWLDPSKTRRTTLVGSRRMLVYDDLDTEGSLRVYDKGVDLLDSDAYGVWRYQMRSNGMHAPALPTVEPLAALLTHFLDCVRTGERPAVDGWNGVRVVAALEAVDASMRADGARVEVCAPWGAAG
ncbi:Gfo/Idh/MocA family oxidoreductase [Luedemannella helvata]|uniref:Gfo/Idh/MocA family oxidoreductase n=1 Tax=Luedemannella helvata TaxID=349315 RepID=A0ABP4WA60_9ACTN